MKLLGLAAFAATAVADDCTTWYETTAHGPGFRNVKNYGAVGDGVTDDTAAILSALTQGRVPMPFSTKDPTIVYLPPGNYLVSQTLPLYFYTHLVGNFKCVPTITLKAGAFGNKRAYVIEADPNDFYRGLMNVNIVTQGNNGNAIGVHWAMSQATFIRNVLIDMSAGGAMGIFMENGSGGFMSDLVVKGADTCIEVGNQQWSWRNITVMDCNSVGINLIWDWAFTFLGLNIMNTPIGIQFNEGSDGHLLLLDSSMTNVSLGISTGYPAHYVGLFLERFTANAVPTIAPGLTGSTGTAYVPSWRQGLAIANNNQPMAGNQSTLPLTRADQPLPQRPRPNFGGADGTTNFSNVYDFGAKGDGVTDDTTAIQTAINNSPSGQVFLPQGIYLVSSPIQLKANTVLVGEVLSNIMASSTSTAWTDAANPQPMLQLPVGGSPQLADLIFTSSGDVPGCLFLDWQSGAGTGAWDVHWRAYHTGWGLLRISGPTAGGVLENSWAWVADHDIDSGASITVVNPRGVLIEGAAGGFMCLGCAAEHSALYQYNITGSHNVTILIAQTETPYWQNPPTAWAMTVSDTTAMRMYGSGFWNWPQFQGVQSAVFQVTGSPDIELFGINTYGTPGVVQVGDVTLSNATLPALNQWFTEGYIANVH